MAIESAKTGAVALVTGGASGIGRAIAHGFAAQGTRVVVADVSSGAGESTTRELREQTGTEALFVRTDVLQPADIEAVVAQTLAAFGRLDFAVNCAGITGPASRVADVTEAEWATVIGINLTGVWLSMKHEIPAILAGGGGAIVNIASTAGLRGGRGTSAYAASKHGVVGLTKSAALDYARAGIRINAVCPGSTQTPMLDRIIGGNEKLSARLTASTAMGRAAQPDEIAAMVLWLCSDAASYVSGQAIAVDGGGAG